ncbi:Crp/Fnr family transcriptional regulator [Funiculus sociatus]|uniref:Crp/Fnr family transcriptional regulator n=1 Tax=Funiculus sociatus TaxID=450527 RepID=UPI00329A67C1
MPPFSSSVLEIDQYDPNETRRLHFYSKNEEIPLVPQGVWQVDRGLVQMSTICANGDEVLLGWSAPSMFFGQWVFQSLKGIHPLAQPNAAIIYHALSDVYLKWFSILEIEASGRLAQIILPQMVRRMQQTEALLAIVGHRRVEDRLHRLLLLLKQEVGQPVAGGTRLSVRLTHQNIASAIGTTRVTITRLLSKLQGQGWISLDCDRHIILKEESFAGISD